MTLILASSSTIRAELLRAAHVPVEVDPAHVDEDTVKAALEAEGAPARDIADALAALKAEKISARHPGRLVLGCDQVLDVGGQRLDKPTSLDEARDHLCQLRGRQHKLWSAAVIAEDARPVWRHVARVTLTMRPFTDAFLDSYLAAEGDGLRATVGAYRLEGRGAQLFSAVDGDYFATLGLPLLQVLGFLRSRGVVQE